MASTIVVPTASAIGACAPEVATNLKAAGDPDARVANALIDVATAAKTDIEALQAGTSLTAGVTERLTVTIGYAAISAAGTTKSVVLGGVLPASASFIALVTVNTTAAFVAVGLSRLDLTIGVTGTSDIMSSTRIESATVRVGTIGTNPYTNNGGGTVTAYFTATGANLNTLSAGSVTLELLYTLALTAS
jgi:hypothetical protein